MHVLAIETVTREGSLALLGPEGCGVSIGHESRTHGERLPGEALELLARHGRTLADVDHFAVVAGPGSFTGLRVGMAVIQGFALVTGRPVAPVPTLEAIAEGWRIGTGHMAPGTRTGGLSEPRNPGTPEPRNSLTVIACIDGQRGDVFFAAWRLDVGETIEQARTIVAPDVGSPDELVARVRDERIDEPAVIVGVHLERHAGALQPLGFPLEELSMPLAEVAARTAARRPELAGAPHALRPIYIRRPDAVLARERARTARP